MVSIFLREARTSRFSLQREAIQLALHFTIEIHARDLDRELEEPVLLF